MDVNATLPHKSEELWYTAGSVVIRAGNTLFCVYADTLAQRSAVFRDLFSTPQPTVDAQEVFEGKPIVPIFDPPDHALAFLKAVHDPTYLEQKVLTDTVTIMNVLPLTLKYHVCYLHAILLKALSQNHWPVTLEDYLRVWRLGELTTSLSSKSLCTRLVNQAEALYTPVLLPVGLYLCCGLLSTREVLEGFTDDDGSHIELAAPYKILVVDGWKKLARASRSLNGFVFFPAPQDSPDCTRQQQCSRNRATYAAIIDSDAMGTMIFIDFDVAWGQNILATSFCDGCIRVWRTQFERGLRREWARLPSTFGLPSSWDELAEAGRLIRSHELSASYEPLLTHVSTPV